MDGCKSASTWLVIALLILLFGCGVGGDEPAVAGEEPAPPVQVAPLRAEAATLYVRTDGGDASQCTGLVDAPYPGSGSAQPCAWAHPFYALPPGGPARIQGGDTLLIGEGSYAMGFGAPGADVCDEGGSFDCHMAPVPSGPDAAHPTRILGAGWQNGCRRPPELWGTERPWFILNLTGSSHVEVACLEITDHSGCVEFHSGGMACERETPPYGPWAAYGLYAEDATDVTLRHLNIHGLAWGGIHAGRLTDWRVEDVRIAGNGGVGWDGDIGGDSADSGDMHLLRFVVEWNGCGETYPGSEPVGCWGQTAGGYGDGMGTESTGGQWVFEDSAFLHNTSDGLDLLYVREAGSSIEIRRTRAEGNAGDQIKTTGPTLIENVVAVSNCGFFEGKPFTHHVDPCRAGGSALAFNLHPGDLVTVVNATVTGQGDCLVLAECVEGESCAGSERVRLRNSVFLGHPEVDPSDTTCLAWAEGLAHDPFEMDHLLIADVKDMPEPCPADSVCGGPLGLARPAIDNFDGHLLPGSPAIDAGTTEGAPPDDVEGQPRDSLPDIGAYEWRATSSRVYLPLAVRVI
jgi:hypothetical protein